MTASGAGADAAEHHHGAAHHGGASDERHANNLELFLDLVFVFAVTQITGVVAHDHSWVGLGRAALVAWLVWWQWSQFTWAGAAVDLQRDPITRLLVLSAIPATLVMVVAIPHAFGSSGRWFGVAYLAVQLLVLAMQGSEALRHAQFRGSFVRYASLAAIAPVAVIIGGFLDGEARVGAWIIAAVLDVLGGLLGARGEWRINAVHFAERHALFVIIALGEVLVGAGLTASKLGLDGHVVLGLAVATSGACVIWWTYFAFIPHVAEHALRHHAGPRGVLARDLFTFGHFPIVAGLIAYAVAVEHVVHHPTATLPATERALLACAIGLLMAAYLHIQLRLRRGFALERGVLVVVVATWCALTRTVPAWIVVGVVIGLLGLTQAITWRRFRQGALRAISPNR